MLATRIDISENLDGEAVISACLELGHEALAASAHAVAAVTSERFRTASMSGDDVIALREFTALADELATHAGEEGIRTVVMSPARLSAYREAVISFVETRDGAEWIREEDREPLAIVRGLLFPLEELSAESIRAALSGAPRPC